MQGQPPCYSKLDNGSIIRIQWARRKGTRAHFVGYYGRSEARLRLVLYLERRKQAYIRPSALLSLFIQSFR